LIQNPAFLVTDFSIGFGEAGGEFRFPRETFDDLNALNGFGEAQDEVIHQTPVGLISRAHPVGEAGGK